MQHASNPVWWQQWSKPLIEEAVRLNMPLFVSSGYATCHWCHVMASGAFSDKDTAGYLNDHFISIKIDREQRPDIDQFMMSFLNAQNGSGGWPLNVFLTPGLHPIFALTYAPVRSDHSMPAFLDIVKEVYEYYENNKNDIPRFIADIEQPDVVEEKSLISSLSAYFDTVHGGIGGRQKFPPHNTLLYILYFLCVENNHAARDFCVKTLDVMRLNGLNDHLQGGIFRYCVDREWTVPHFEKMLYDQAMALWCYSLAYRVLEKNEYKTMSENIIKCLDECFGFGDGELFITAHDADTKHLEGATYTWSYDELKSALSPDEFIRFSGSYLVERNGNFEGRIHLIRKNDGAPGDIESKLLAIRNKRDQPVRDDKVLCGLNALAAIALIQAGRNLEKPELEEKASRMIRRLAGMFWDGNELAHSCFNQKIQKQSFLFDAAAMLTAMSMLFEGDSSWSDLMAKMSDYVETFKDGDNWIESRLVDFMPVGASWFDHPIPSSVGLAEMGLARFALLSGKNIRPKPYRQPFQSDFFNVSAMMQNGLFHLITSKKSIPWGQLPPNTIRARGETETDCYRGTCRML